MIKSEPLFTVDFVLFVSSDHELQHALGWFSDECEVAGMRVSMSKSEAMFLCWKMMDCSLRVASLRSSLGVWEAS